MGGDPHVNDGEGSRTHARRIQDAIKGSVQGPLAI